MITTRRVFLRAGMAAGTAAIALGAGLLSPKTALAAWPTQAFKATSMEDALKALEGTTATSDSADIKVEAPDIAENGAVVSVTVKTTLPNVESISLLVPVNASPLTASYLLSQGTEGFVTGRIKMAKTSDVIAIVKSGGKLHTAKKPVKVTLGGCGG